MPISTLPLRDDLLDIVTYAVPYPPVYGGAIDSFYRIKALGELGQRIRLHCFLYGPHKPAPELDAYCDEVIYYKRRGSPSLLSSKPFIMASRKHPELLKNLSDRSGPVLYDGMHTCGLIDNPALLHRKAIVRMHNIEWEYYMFLARTARSWWKRSHFHRESLKLRKVEMKVLERTDIVLTISRFDTEYYNPRHPHVELVRPFHQYDDIIVERGEGSYVLLQGDLSIDDNLDSAYKMAQVCVERNIPCKIAGRAPSPVGREKLASLGNLEMHFDVPESEMIRLMTGAHVQVIDAAITSGFKLKLVSALFTARHIVARKTLVSKLLRDVVHSYADSDEVGPLLAGLMQKPVSREDIAHRRSVILPAFSNRANAERLLKLIWEE